MPGEEWHEEQCAYLYYCPHCDKVTADVAVSTALMPVTVNSKISVALVIGCLLFWVHGRPLKVLLPKIAARFDLTKQEILDALKDFGQIYLKPLHEAMRSQAKTCPAWVAGSIILQEDEQGNAKRILVHATASPKMREDGRIIPALQLCDIRSKDQVEQAGLDDMLSRTLEQMMGLEGGSPEGLCLAADDAGSYEGLCAGHNIALQESIGNLRLKVLCDLRPSVKGIGFSTYRGKKGMAVLKRDLFDDDPRLLLSAVLFLIDKLYCLELNADDAKVGQSVKVRQALRANYGRKIMDLIDEFMHKLSSMQEREFDSCAYYFEKRDALRVFLDHPLPAIDPDTCYLVPWTKAAGLDECSPEEAELFCQAFGIIKTYEAANLDPGWLLEDYCQSVFEHCLGLGALKVAKAKGEIADDPDFLFPLDADYDFEDGIKSFDPSPFLPGNYYPEQSKS